MAVRGTTKFESNKQEKRVAEQLGGKTVIASGSLWGSKGDVRTDCFLIECKTTKRHRYSLSSYVWDKIEKEAIKDGIRLPIMFIDLLDGRIQMALFKTLDFSGFEHSCMLKVDNEKYLSRSSTLITGEPTIYHFPKYDLSCLWSEDFLDFVNKSQDEIRKVVGLQR